ncbi:LuxR C-terminal-related transcriptional regulator [Serratia fonticola]|uniref:helix-turn-helix transcriptional regulator n=1 Tax=Serratia fonticola TaxID=47917 RepID=UPI003AB0BCD4
MDLIDSNYSCALSTITFKSLIASLTCEPTPALYYGEGSIAFVDGDSANIYSVVKSVYELRKNSEVVYMVTLLSKDKDCSSVIRHLSDHVVDKKITYAELGRLIRTMVKAKPKALADNVFGDIWGDIFKSSQKEYLVLKLLLDGHSQYQIAKMLNLSIKTISGYKVKAIKRHGARNFNELYMLKLSKNA